MGDAGERNTQGRPLAPGLGSTVAETPAAEDPRGIRSQEQDSQPGVEIHEFDPLRFCPVDKRSRYERRIEAARTQPKVAVTLKCLDCCAWDRREVRRCEIATCALYALSARYFGRAEASAPEDAGDAGDELLEAADA